MVRHSRTGETWFRLRLAIKEYEFISSCSSVAILDDSITYEIIFRQFAITRAIVSGVKKGTPDHVPFAYKTRVWHPIGAVLGPPTYDETTPGWRNKRKHRVHARFWLAAASAAEAGGELHSMIYVILPYRWRRVTLFFVTSSDVTRRHTQWMATVNNGRESDERTLSPRRVQVMDDDERRRWRRQWLYTWPARSNTWMVSAWALQATQLNVIAQMLSLSLSLSLLPLALTLHIDFKRINSWQ